jgi:hypothetical protein
MIRQCDAHAVDGSTPCCVSWCWGHSFPERPLYERAEAKMRSERHRIAAVPSPFPSSWQLQSAQFLAACTESTVQELQVL